MDQDISRACKLLLVEDSDDEVLAFRGAVARIPGFEIVGRVSNGGDAVEYLGGMGRYRDRKRYPWPDVVILEIRMPGRGGLEVLEWMHGKEAMPEVAIFTRTEGEDEKTRAIELGAAVYQHKTFEIEVIERFLHWVRTSHDSKASEKERAERSSRAAEEPRDAGASR